RPAAVRRSRQCDDLLAILRVAAAVIEDHVRRAIGGIDGHPLKELVRAVVRGIVVDAHSGTPCFTVVSGGRAEYIHLPIAGIPPCQIEATAFRAAPGINGNLCKT